MIKVEMLTANGHKLETHVGIPEGKGPFPTMLLMYHRGGFDEFTQNRIEALVADGYLTITPDIFYRAPTDAEDRKTFLKDSDAVAAIKAAHAYAVSHPLATKGKIGIIGHCMGGRLAVQGAAILPDLAVAVALYGGGTFVSWGNEGTPPSDFIGNIRCPVIGFYGNLDKNPSPEEVNRLDALMTQHGVEHVFHRYPNVGHGFQQVELGRGGDAERFASDDAWAKMNAFVSDKMKLDARVA